MALIRRNFRSVSQNSEEGSSISSSSENLEEDSEHLDLPRNPEEMGLNYGRLLLNRRDRLLGRIGTHATVTSVRLEPESSQEHQNRVSSEIIVTALTT